MKATAYDVLARAHELLAEGWCQGQSVQEEDGKRSYCIAGALHRAQVDLGLTSSMAAPLPQAVQNKIRAGTGPEPITTWNDKRGRTQAQVLAMVARAAENARGKGEK